jgi:TonB-dependent receptor
MSKLVKCIALPCILIMACLSASYAQTIKGNVTDAKSGEPLIGAMVHIENGKVVFNTAVKLDGTFLIKDVPAGTYTVKLSFLGYKAAKEYSVVVTDNHTVSLPLVMVDKAADLNEVTVTEHANKESEGSARNMEKNANNTMNVVSAGAIAISPDVIVSNVLGRVSGISMDRSNTGDAQHVIIRGMNKQYNTTLINGVKIPSPDNKNRYVPLDIFPADLVEKIEVSKSLTPDMEGDASGGVVNLVMKTAPNKLRVEGNVGIGYSQMFFNRDFQSFNTSTVNSKSPGEIHPGQPATISEFPYQNVVTKPKSFTPNENASLTVGNRYLNNKLGVILSGTYQNTYQGDNSFVVVQENTVGPAPNAHTPNQETAFQSSYKRQYSSQLSRLGTIASIDYKFNDRNTLQLFGTYLQLNEHRVRETQNSIYGGYSYLGYKGTNSMDSSWETRSNLQSIYNITLKGTHKVTDKFNFDWTLADSKATHKQPDIAEFKTSYQTSPDQNNGQNVPDPNSPGSTVFVTNDIIRGPKTVSNESRVWLHNTDKDLSGYLNLHYTLNSRVLLSVGGMYRHKTRDNYTNSYDLPNTLITGTNNDELFTSIPASTFSFDTKPANALGSSASDPGVYQFTENIGAGYGMVKYDINKKLNVLFGLRVEHTYQSYYSNLPSNFPGKSANIKYMDYLGSINAKYSLTNNQALRASFYQSILRPAFADFIPYPDLTSDNPNASLGNPYLQHTKINNFDLRYEFFPGVVDEFMLGGFYKALSNPIETVLQPGGSGATLFLQPENLGTAHNYGFELVARKFFGRIGGSVNYTFTQSQITTPKSIDVQNVGVTSREQTRPLQGQAANTGNASLLYKNTKAGIDAQLSLSYTGERIAAVSQYYGLDTWEKASTFLDFSAQKDLGKHFIIFVKANNLLNTPYRLFIKQNNSTNSTGILKYEYQNSAKYTTVQYDRYYARYNMGFRFKF